MENLKNINNGLDYTCIFGGGAIRGFSYAGALKALEDLNINISTLAGSSVGAIFATLMAVGYNAGEVKDIFLHANFELFRDIHLGFGKNFAISKGEVFLEEIRDLIEKKFYGYDYSKGKNKPVTFADLEKNLVIITTNLTDFKYKEFSKFETPDVEIAYAVRISCTMPALMKPIVIDDAIIVDGDLQKGRPQWLLSKNLYSEDNRILEFRLEGEFDKNYTNNPLSFMNTIYTCATSFSTNFIIETYGHRDKFDYIKINTGDVLLVDFNISKEKREEMMDIAYNQTMNYFENELVAKKKNIIKHYKKIYKYLNTTNKKLKYKNYKAAKETLGDLYLNLENARDYIDTKYINALESFKNNFLTNLSTTILKTYTLKNEDAVKQDLETLCHSLKDKITEFEKFLQNQDN